MTLTEMHITDALPKVIITDDREKSDHEVAEILQIIRTLETDTQIAVHTTLCNAESSLGLGGDQDVDHTAQPARELFKQIAQIDDRYPVEALKHYLARLEQINDKRNFITRRAGFWRVYCQRKIDYLSIKIEDADHQVAAYFGGMEQKLRTLFSETRNEKQRQLIQVAIELVRDKITRHATVAAGDTPLTIGLGSLTHTRSAEKNAKFD